MEHAAAVEAIALWTSVALQSYASSSSSDFSIEDSTLEQATAAALATQWIQDGLTRIQHQQSTSEATITTSEDSSDSVREETRLEQLGVVLEVLRRTAESVTSDAIQCVLAQLAESEITPTSEHLVEFQHDERDRLQVVTAAVENDIDGPPTSDTTEDPVAIPPSVPQLLLVEVSHAVTTQDSESRSLVVSQFITTLLHDAVHHHVSLPIKAADDPSPLLSQTLFNLPSSAPSALTAEWTSSALNQHTDDGATNTVRLPSRDVHTPRAVLATVKPPKQAHRRPQRQTMTTTSPLPSPRLGPLDPPKQPPKTAEQHHHLHAIGGRTPRTSPRPVTHDHDSSPSPPRLRKLEEYLELHPIDRAKLAYRPRRPPHKHHRHTRSHVPTHDSNEYDAEHEESDEDEVSGHVTLPHVKLAPLRGTPTMIHPEVPSPTTISMAGPTVVDRPDRLGLLNKPKKRSGFCQQCGYEGRSCKISDCLKHQLLR